MRPKVDILVLAHNGLEVTKRFVDLIYQHTENFDLYVLDNGSTDGTEQWFLSELDRFHDKVRRTDNLCIRRSDVNLGVIGGRNEVHKIWLDNPPTDGVEHICFLDNDQFVQRGWLEDHFSYMKNYDVVGVEAWRMRNDFMPVARLKHPRAPFNYVGCGGMLMHRKVADNIGLFDPLFDPAYFEDPDFVFRAQENGFRVGWNPKAKITHLAHQTLGNMEWRKKFDASHEKFKKKWAGKKAPIFQMI